MSYHDDRLKQRLQDPEFREAFEAAKAEVLGQFHGCCGKPVVGEHDYDCQDYS